MADAAEIQIDVAEVARAFARLREAVVMRRPLSVIRARYVAYVVACEGTHTHAAERLGVSRRSLVRWASDSKRGPKVR